MTVINASAAVTLLEQRPEKNSGSERDSNPAQSLNFFQVSVLVVKHCV